MNPLKIVVSGPVGAGKTTFIKNLSETPVVETDELATEDIGKMYTTVAMDFGTFQFDDIPVYLFGTPGQDRFDFMWEILCEDALGLILLVAGHKPEDFPHAKNILDFITSRIPIPFVIGVTHQDLDMVWEPEDVADYFDIEAENVVGIHGSSVTYAVNCLIQLLSNVMEHSGGEEVLS